MRCVLTAEKGNATLLSFPDETGQHLPCSIWSSNSKSQLLLSAHLQRNWRKKKRTNHTICTQNHGLPEPDQLSNSTMQFRAFKSNTTTNLRIRETNLTARPIAPTCTKREIEGNPRPQEERERNGEMESRAKSVKPRVGPACNCHVKPPVQGPNKSCSFFVIKLRKWDSFFFIWNKRAVHRI